MLDDGTAAAGDARIVNIASIAGLVQLPGLTADCASRSAVISLTRGLAREWAKRHIAVNAIAPGYIETEINSDWFSTDAGKAQIEGFPRQRLIDTLPDAGTGAMRQRSVRPSGASESLT